MSNPHEDPAALKALQDSIYRERIHEGAMKQLKLTDPLDGWREVSRRLNRLQQMNDRGRFTTVCPLPQ